MSSGIIPAIYEDGIFRPLERPDGLAEHQQVQLYFVIDELWISEPLPSEENVHFVRETMGIWQIEDQGFRRWLAEDVSLFDE